MFVVRAEDKGTDAGLLNGVGGKLEPGENYLDCAVRETIEETGYQVTPADCTMVGLVNLTGGYQEDWVMGFFVVEVPSLEVPVGMSTSEGEFRWLAPAELFSQEVDVVDDLTYCWDALVARRRFFLAATLNAQEKIISHSLSFAE